MPRCADVVAARPALQSLISACRPTLRILSLRSLLDRAVSSLPGNGQSPTGVFFVNLVASRFPSPHYPFPIIQDQEGEGPTLPLALSPLPKPLFLDIWTPRSVLGDRKLISDWSRIVALSIVNFELDGSIRAFRTHTGKTTPSPGVERFLHSTLQAICQEAERVKQSALSCPIFSNNSSHRRRRRCILHAPHFPQSDVLECAEILDPNAFDAGHA